MRAIPDRQAASIESLSRAGRIPLPLAPLPRLSGPGASMPAQSPRAQSCEELALGLMQQQAQISPKFLYDAQGCALFEQITRLPEYYPTRTEAVIMTRFEPEIAEAMAGCQVLIELGAGNCEKVRRLCRSVGPQQFVGVDIAVEFLQAAVARLEQDFPQLSARAVAADFTGDWHLPPGVPQARRELFYPGSSIGNFDTQQALHMLRHMHSLVAGDGGLLIGIDLPKPEPVLVAAYDDEQGVTAEFNLNVLQHVNRLLGSDFDLQDWAHEARFDRRTSRIEMHLRARRPVMVCWPQGLRHFARGETIHTENSYKYPLSDFLDLLACAGFVRPRVWTDEQQWFAVIHAHA
ncbi:Histidine N-alpha-methyltransferase [Comamonas sp. PE63]|uniref:Histidine N-alpha-methyltransferase n=2 Tax=Comamonas brasiliensis TaxID=1812482 RepID=A0ABS5LMT0_9BURK|nr:Histidine N-alpha-methyltransferase [Comamonas sp. PE63]